MSEEVKLPQPPKYKPVKFRTDLHSKLLEQKHKVEVIRGGGEISLPTFLVEAADVFVKVMEENN